MELPLAKEKIENALRRKDLIFAVGKCFINYKGRASSRLEEGERLIIIKGDGAFMVHQKGKLAPVNYQAPGTTITLELQDDFLLLKGVKKKPLDVLEVYFSEVSKTESFTLQDNESIEITGMEKHISDKLAQDLEIIEPGLKSVKRESSGIIGAIDVFALDKDNNPVVIEVKRRKADFNAVMQLSRYVKHISKRKEGKTRGILCAPAITDNAKTFLDNAGLEFFKLDYEVGDETTISGQQEKQKGLKDYLTNRD